MIAYGEWNGGKIFEGIAANGNSVFFDADSVHAQGPSPMETARIEYEIVFESGEPEP